MLPVVYARWLRLVDVRRVALLRSRRWACRSAVSVSAAALLASASAIFVASSLGAQAPPPPAMSTSGQFSDGTKLTVTITEPDPDTIIVGDAVTVRDTAQVVGGEVVADASVVLVFDVSGLNRGGRELCSPDPLRMIVWSINRRVREGRCRLSARDQVSLDTKLRDALWMLTLIEEGRPHSRRLHSRSEHVRLRESTREPVACREWLPRPPFPRHIACRDAYAKPTRNRPQKEA
jgi:hypothetical protein